MKILNTIITIAILFGIIFFVKNNYPLVYNDVFSFFKNSLNNSSNVKDTVSNIASEINSSINNPIKNIKNNVIDTNVETPGALIISDTYLINKTADIKLTAKGIINETNKNRLENGNIPSLVENSELDFSAEKKLQDMFTKQYFEHISPSGVGVSNLAEQVGYEYIIIGENLALGNFKDDKSLVDAWMASPGHKANILNKGYKEIGVAVGKGNYLGKTIWMAVQHFGLPKSSCPSIDEVLHGIINIDQNKIKTMQDDMAIRKAKIDSGVVYEGLTTMNQIDIYNSLVNDYNKAISDVKEKINQYNEQVRAFNTCLSSVN